MAVALVLVGILVRVAAWARAPALDYDGLLVTLNLGSRSYADLLRPLDLGQTAPPLYLWFTKASMDFLGASPRALRLLPLLCGVAVLPMIWLLLRRLTAPWPAAFGMAVAVAAPTLTVYANRVKPYEGDALIGAVLTWLAIQVLDRPDDRTALTRLGVVSGIAPLVSSTSVFVLVGVWATLLVYRPLRPMLGRLLLFAGVSGLVVVVLVWTVHADAGDPTKPLGAYMAHYWNQYFLVDGPEGLQSRAFRLLDGVTARALFGAPPDWKLLVGLLGLGGVFLGGRRPWVLGVFLLPLLALVAASAMGRYPLADRLVLFTVPTGVVFLSVGTETLVSPLRPGWRPAAFLLVAVALLWGGLGTVVRSVEPQSHSRERTMEALVDHMTPVVYWMPGAAPRWLYHSTDWTRPNRDRLRWAIPLVDLAGPVSLFRPSEELFGPQPIDTAALVYHRDPWIELIGIPSGMRSMLRGQTEPDSGWAAGEVARVRRVWKTGCAAFLLMTAYPPEQHAMVVALNDVRADLEYIGSTMDFWVVLRACLPPG